MGKWERSEEESVCGGVRLRRERLVAEMTQKATVGGEARLKKIPNGQSLKAENAHKNIIRSAKLARYHCRANSLFPTNGEGLEASFLNLHQ